MTNEAAIRILKHELYKAQKQLEPCQDAISRQAVIDALMQKVRVVNGTYYFEYAEVINKDDALGAIKALPPVQPERKKGKWIRLGDDGYCSVCREDMPMCRMDWDRFEYCATPFCPNCGTKMEEGEQNDDIKAVKFKDNIDMLQKVIYDKIEEALREEGICLTSESNT